MLSEDITLIGIGLILLEIAFWLLLGKYIYKRRKAKRSIWDKQP